MWVRVAAHTAGAMMDDEDAPTAADVLREFRVAMAEVGAQFKEAFDKVQEESQYRFDKELAKQLAKHPELYAELRRSYRQIRRGVEKASRDWGLR